jgi:hypothetical protein
MQSIRHSDTGNTSDTKIQHTSCVKYLITSSSIKFNNTATKEIERIIKAIRVKNLQGYDGITTKILKVSAPYIRSPLNYICNKCIRFGTFPTCLKYSIVKPLFKKRMTGKTWLITDQSLY